jgi:hypothetical protein
MNTSRVCNVTSWKFEKYFSSKNYDNHSCETEFMSLSKFNFEQKLHLIRFNIEFSEFLED